MNRSAHLSSRYRGLPCVCVFFFFKDRKIGSLANLPDTFSETSQIAIFNSDLFCYLIGNSEIFQSRGQPRGLHSSGGHDQMVERLVRRENTRSTDGTTGSRTIWENLSTINPGQILSLQKVWGRCFYNCKLKFYGTHKRCTLKPSTIISLLHFFSTEERTSNCNENTAKQGVYVWGKSWVG